MSTVATPEIARDLTHAGQLLAERVRQRLGQLGDTTAEKRPMVLRAEVGLENVDPISWLAAQTNPIRLYYSGRDGNCESAGIGLADEIDGADGTNPFEALRHLQTVLADINGPVRYFGGMRFDTHAAGSAISEPWTPFGRVRFILPRFELSRSPQGTVLAANLVPDTTDADINAVIADLNQLRTRNRSTPHLLPEIIERSDCPDRDRWGENVDSALELIRSGVVDKLVLARRATLHLSVACDPVQLTSRLRDAAVSSTLFCFQFGETAFVGATPEQLYHRDGRRLASEAIGGTRPRSSDPEKDAALGLELLHSSKDLSEHRWVADAVEKSLWQFCRTVNRHSTFGILKLAALQHLVTRFSGSLGSGVYDADIVAKLHPTPAVAGSRRDRALAAIAQLESFDRGWYAGPIGRVSHDAAEFVVAIRSGLLQGNRLYIYAGSGLVRGSTSDDEWDEAESKMRGLVRLFES